MKSRLNSNSLMERILFCLFGARDCSRREYFRVVGWLWYCMPCSVWLVDLYSQGQTQVLDLRFEKVLCPLDAGAADVVLAFAQRYVDMYVLCEPRSAFPSLFLCFVQGSVPHTSGPRACCDARHHVFVSH